MCFMTQSTDTGEHRIERDTMGEVRVPAAALWKAQTQRAVENFPISGIPINSELIAALGLIKEAAAKTNAALGVLRAGVRRCDRESCWRGRGEPARCRVSHRRLPDRVGHLEQHERQRGDRFSRLCSAG